MASMMTVGAHGRDVTAPEAAQLTSQPAVQTGPITFRSVLEALNPLQYLPVVGSIYRVATGDEGSPTLRTAISLVSGVLMGGPVGLLTSMAGEIFGHYFDFEGYARTALVTGNKPAAPTALAAAATPPAPAAPAAAPPAAAQVAASSPAPAAAPASVAPQAAVPQAGVPPAAAAAHLATQAVAAYARVTDMPTRFIPGGAER